MSRRIRAGLPFCFDNGAAVANVLDELAPLIYSQLGAYGKPQFYDLMRRRSPQHFYAFDVLWLNGRDRRDLRELPLIKRKRLVRGIIPPQPSPLLYVDHVVGSGVDLYRAACEQDLEGVVAKPASGRYEP